MRTLYIGNKNYSSWSLRPWVLMRTLGIAFEERLVRFGTDAFAQMGAVSPTGLVPCLVEDGEAVWDSLAITEYLAENHAGVWPSDRTARAFARAAAAEMHSGFSALRSVCTMTVGQRIVLYEEPAGLKRDLDRLEALWAMGFERFGGPFLAGSDFTAADAFFCPVAFRVQTFGLKLDARSTAYGERLLALPAMREWEADALAEAFRDPAHEEEIPAIGTVNADERAQPTSA